MPNSHNRGRWQKIPVTLQTTNGDTIHILISGRVRWALECLIKAGPNGCTPIEYPGPRWSDYVFRLRGEGVEIETVTEEHDGPFAGTHARYVLRSKLIPRDATEAA